MNFSILFWILRHLLPIFILSLSPFIVDMKMKLAITSHNGKNVFFKNNIPLKRPVCVAIFLPPTTDSKSERVVRCENPHCWAERRFKTRTRCQQWEILALARPRSSAAMCGDKRQVVDACCNRFGQRRNTWVCLNFHALRPTAVSLHLASRRTARVLTNWQRQAVQFSCHLTHTSWLRSALVLLPHTLTQSHFYAT